MNGLQRTVIEKITLLNKKKNKLNFLPLSLTSFIYTAFKDYRLMPI